jgi:hypothetical protein
MWDKWEWLMEMQKILIIKSLTYLICVSHWLGFCQTISDLHTSILVMAMPHFRLDVHYLVVDAFSIKWLLATFLLNHFSNFLADLQLCQCTRRVVPAHVPFFVGEPTPSRTQNTLGRLVHFLHRSSRSSSLGYDPSLHILVMMAKGAER